MSEKSEWQNMSPDEKRKQLFLNQKATLDAFLARGAITVQQYNKSLGDLKAKMGIDEE